MSILFLPLTVPGTDPSTGVLTRAIPRELASYCGRAPGAEPQFFPFAHLVEGKRVFGVYDRRWETEDLRRLLARAPDADLLVHGDLDPGDPFRMELQVLRIPELTTVAEKCFEAPRFGGFSAIEEGARFVLEAAGLPALEGEARFPAKGFEAYLALLRGREAAAALDPWGEGAAEEVEAAFDHYFAALDLEPGLEAAREELSLLGMSTALCTTLPAEAAQAPLARLVELDPGGWRGWAALGQVRAAAGELPGAVEAYEKALTIDPGRAALRFDMGMLLLRQDRTGPAAKALETVRTDPQVGAAALFELGRIRVAKNDGDGAVALWTEAAERAPDRPDIRAALGRLHASRGEFDEAESAFAQGLEIEGESPSLELGYGVYLAEQDRFREATAHLHQALRLLGSEPLAHLHLGRALAADGDRNPALHHYRKALRAGGDVGPAAREAISELTDVEREVRFLDLLAEVVEHPADAQVGLLKKLLKEEKAHVEARIRLGIALVAMGKGRAAEKEFRRALKIAPEDPEIWSGLATALRTRGRLDGAVAAHEEAIERAPNHAPYHLNLADTLLRMDRPREAAAQVDRARALDPRHPLLPSFVGAVKVRLGEQTD